MAVVVHGPAEIAALRRAGKVAAQTLAHVGAQLRAGMTTAAIDALVRADTAARGAMPSQLGYNGFPAAVCTSKNEVVCHGVPSPRVRLDEGDIVNVDVTSELEGFHGDTSITYALGTPPPDAQRVLAAARACLERAIAVVRPGARLGDIGAAIVEEATRRECTVVEEFCGHGIGRRMHMPPQVSHVGKAGTGLRLQPGMCFTIEPMITIGRPRVVVLEDGWTAVTIDGSPSAQFEHTVLVTERGAEVLTRP
jgi:methionyl aminopeptidase